MKLELKVFHENMMYIETIFCGKMPNFVLLGGCTTNKQHTNAG